MLKSDLSRIGSQQVKPLSPAELHTIVCLVNMGSFSVLLFTPQALLQATKLTRQLFFEIIMTHTTPRPAVSVLLLALGCSIIGKAVAGDNRCPLGVPAISTDNALPDCDCSDFFEGDVYVIAFGDGHNRS